MLSLKQALSTALIAASVAVAQPALTTIQDTLYRADGSRFTGTVYLTYSSFQGADTSNIATSNLTIRSLDARTLVNKIFETFGISAKPSPRASSGFASASVTWMTSASRSATAGNYWPPH